MILTIDKKIIDFTLENETVLKEVIENINLWLSENQLIIEKLYVNNEDYSMHDLDIDLEDISNIDIETLTFTELNINNLSWIKYFFERLIIAIETWNLIELNQVKSEIPFVIKHLPTILSLDNKTPENTYSEKLSSFLEKYNFFDCKDETVNKDEVILFLNNIVLLLTERLHEYINARQELKSSIEILLTLQEELESVSILLQSNKSNEAAIIMNKFTNVFHKILRIIKFNLNNSDVTHGQKLDSFTNGLDDILNELIEGYESQDTVLIGDILEYELSPKIKVLKDIFS